MMQPSEKFILDCFLVKRHLYWIELFLVKNWIELEFALRFGPGPCLILWPKGNIGPIPG